MFSYFANNDDGCGLKYTNVSIPLIARQQKMILRNEYFKVEGAILSLKYLAGFGFYL